MATPPVEDEPRHRGEPVDPTTGTPRVGGLLDAGLLAYLSWAYRQWSSQGQFGFPVIAVAGLVAIVRGVVQGDVVSLLVGAAFVLGVVAIFAMPLAFYAAAHRIGRPKRLANRPPPWIDR